MFTIFQFKALASDPFTNEIGLIREEPVVEVIQEEEVVVEETAAGTEEVAASSKDLNLGMQDVNKTSVSLRAIAEELQDGVQKFTISNKKIDSHEG